MDDSAHSTDILKSISRLKAQTAAAVSGYQFFGQPKSDLQQLGALELFMWTAWSEFKKETEEAIAFLTESWDECLMH